MLTAQADHRLLVGRSTGRRDAALHVVLEYRLRPGLLLLGRRAALLRSRAFRLELQLLEQFALRESVAPLWRVAAAARRRAERRPAAELQTLVSTVYCASRSLKQL